MMMMTIMMIMDDDDDDDAAVAVAAAADDDDDDNDNSYDDDDDNNDDDDDVGNPKVNLLVLDVEGAELKVLHTLPWDEVKKNHFFLSWDLVIHNIFPIFYACQYFS